MARRYEAHGRFAYCSKSRFCVQEQMAAVERPNEQQRSVAEILEEKRGVSGVMQVIGITIPCSVVALVTPVIGEVRGARDGQRSTRVGHTGTDTGQFFHFSQG